MYEVFGDFAGRCFSSICEFASFIYLFLLENFFDLRQVIVGIAEELTLFFSDVIDYVVETIENIINIFFNGEIVANCFLFVCWCLKYLFDFFEKGFFMSFFFLQTSSVVMKSNPNNLKLKENKQNNISLEFSRASTTTPIFFYSVQTLFCFFLFLIAHLHLHIETIEAVYFLIAGPYAIALFAVKNILIDDCIMNREPLFNKQPASGSIPFLISEIVLFFILF